MELQVSAPAAQHATAPSVPAASSTKSSGPIRLIVVCALLLSVAIATGTGLFLSSLRNHVLAENERNLSNTALILAKQFEHIFTTLERVQKRIIDQTAAFGIIDAADRERQLSQYDFHLKLRDNAAGMHYVGSLTLVNAEGRVINFSRQWPIADITVVDRDFFKALQSDPNLTSFIGEPVRNRATGTWVMHFSRRISGPNKEFLGLLTAAIELGSLQSNFSEITLESGGRLSLFRQDGMLLAGFPGLDSDIGRVFSNAAALKLVSSADHGVGVYAGAIDGRTRMIAAHRVGSFPIVVAAAKTITAVLADWQRTAAYVVGISILSIVVIVAFALLFVRMFKNYQSLVMVRAEWEKSEQLREQSLRFDVAMNNMSQGLLMFDAQGRLVIINKRYLDIYGLSSDRVKTGCTLQELLEHRKATGTFPGDPGQYVTELRAELGRGKSVTLIYELPDGRVISIANLPMPDGRWLSTHEDITERHRLLQAQKKAEEELREQHLRLETAVSNMSQGLLMFDSSTRIVVCNQRYIQMYRLSPEVVKPGCTLRELIEHRKEAGLLTGDPEQYCREILDTIAQGKTSTWAIETNDGRFIHAVNQPMGGGGWVATHEDITERRRVEKERDRNRAFLDLIIENVPATIIVKDARTLQYVLINRAGEQHYSIPRDEVIGRTAHDVLSKETADFVTRLDRQVLDTPRAPTFSEHVLETPGRGKRIAMSTRLPILDDKGEPQYLLTVVSDVTERKQAEARIAYLAHHDPITELPNRAAFNACIAETIERATQASESFAVLCIDLDRFQEVNDVFGHGVGDRLLREVARRLQIAVGGAFLARLGGDEFTVIVTDGPQPTTTAALADRLLAAVADDIEIEGHALRVGLSIGVAIFPADGADAQSLVGNADAALYRAKAEGRATIRFFEADMDKRLRERGTLQHDLRSALANGQLRLFYQPQALLGGEIVGFEALVRWQHPTRGLVPPTTFIPLAEESGLILPFGEWILREACREAASWPWPLQIAINLSPIQFRHGDLPGLVHSVLLETGLSPQRLELEITEGVLISDFSRAVSILRRLKALGAQIAMDDFGTGYSSLSYLQSFSFDHIKIDQSFISNLEFNPQSATIVRTVIGLARGLQVPVVAEGVETRNQLAFLAREGCDKMQGFLIGRPCPIEEYAELVGYPRTAAARVGAATS